MYYDKLFSLCGYEPEELKRERPRIEKAIKKMSLTEEDFKRAEDRVETYYDIELKGIQKILSVFLKEFVHILLAGEEKKKIIHSMIPSIGGNPAAVVNDISKDFYAGFPDVIFFSFWARYLAKSPISWMKQKHMPFRQEWPTVVRIS
jgi:hypothetical protein